jgi:peptide chain release factor subunit 1
MLTFIRDIDMRALAEMHGMSREYLSLYLPVGGKEVGSENAIFVQRRLRDLKKVLPDAEKAELEQIMDKIGPVIDEDTIPQEMGRVIFATTKGIDYYRISLEAERKLVWDSSPYILPLAMLREEYQPYGLVLVDSRKMVLYLIRSEVLSQMDGASFDLMNKHKKGGMSQRRFQRHREGAIDHFLKRVVEDMGIYLEVEGLRGIVITGPGEPKKQLIELLTPDLSGKVIGVIDLDMDSTCGDLVKGGDIVAARDERAEEKISLEEFRVAVMKGDGGAYGVDEVRGLLEEGRVSMLLIQRGLKIMGWLCESCHNLHEGTDMPGSCPLCGSAVTCVDYVEEIFKLAERSGTIVEFIGEGTYLESVGGLGAILRY